MPVTFHPSADQIEANLFGPASESSLRLLRIMKDLGQDGDIYEVYYQPLIGNEHPDFAVVRQGFKFVKTLSSCTFCSICLM